MEDDNQNHISLYYTLALFSFGCMTLNFVVVLVEYREIRNDGKQTNCLDGNPVFLWVACTTYQYLLGTKLLRLNFSSEELPRCRFF